MAETANPASTQTPAPAAPEAAAPVAASAAPVAAPAPAPEAKAPEAAPVPSPAVEKSLLGAEPKPAEQPKPAEPVKAAEPPKPADAPPPVAEPAKEEGAQSDDPAPLPTYEAFKLPEGIQLDEKTLGEFTKDLAEFETTSKADHAAMQQFGQKLVDRYVAETQTTLQRVQDFYQSHFEKTKSEWKESFERDPEIGGNRKETTINSALEFIRTHGGSAEQQTELRQLMDATGVGNHPAMIRLLAKAQSAMSEGKPVPATKPVPQTKSKVENRYGKT